MNRGLRAAAPLLAVLVPVVSCAALFDDAVQCQDDTDCARFDAVCNAQGVCAKDTSNEDADTDPTPTEEDASDPTPTGDRCNVSPKPMQTIGTSDGGRGEITGPVTLGCDKDWILDSLVFVRSGGTLTIEAGTTIRARTGVGAGIVVARGGKIIAEGKRDLPIVMTSDAATPAAGNWRGIYVLGQAPPSGQTPFDDDPDLAWGGLLPEDDSGVLSYLRIEYARAGLVLAGAGNRTKVDFVQVRRTVENCFTFHGGRVDVKHLVCQSPGDEQFEWALFSGRAQFLFGQGSATPPNAGAHGLLFDSSPPTVGTPPPAVYNVTSCGGTPAALGSGLVFRNGATLDLNGLVATGWASGFDAVGDQPNAGDMRRSIIFGNTVNPAPDDANDPTLDGDFGELDWFDDPIHLNSIANPNLVGCSDAKAPKPWPMTSLTTNAPTPPATGFFDTTASYIGAFKDANDPWMTGAWVRFDDK